MSTKSDFLTGKVFGFDLGTASLAHCVRIGDSVPEIGVLVCPDKSADLESRRGLRGGRRVLDRRQDRRDWFAEGLASVLGIQLHDGTRLAVDAWEKNDEGHWVPTAKISQNPLELRIRAVEGKLISSLELFTALTHLVRKRGYAELVPWAHSAEDAEESAKEAEKQRANGNLGPQEVRAQFEAARNEQADFYPCHYLETLLQDKKRLGQRAWPRDLIELEASSILTKQAAHFPELREQREIITVTGKKLSVPVIDWLLHGNSEEVQRKDEHTGKVTTFRMFHRNHPDRERAPFTFQAARIHNRGPGLDLIMPYNEKGLPQYTMSRSRDEYKKLQVELALLHFNVVNLQDTLKKKRPMVPPPTALEELRTIIAQKGELTVEDLETWVAPYRAAKQFDLVKGQAGLVGKAEGRGRLSKRGIEEALKILRPLQEEHKALSLMSPKGQRAVAKFKKMKPDDQLISHARRALNHTPQLRFQTKNKDTGKMEPEPLPRALARFIREIRDPLVKHRVELFERTLSRLEETHGKPDHIVVECVRAFKEDTDAAADSHERRDKQRQTNKHAHATLVSMGIEPNKKNIRKFSLLQECKWRCPYTLERFMQEDFASLIIQRMAEVPVAAITAARQAFHSTQVEHMVPQTATICDEWYNLTVTRPSTNSAKGTLIPFEFVLKEASKETRKDLLDNASACFGDKSLKYSIFSQPDARSLIDEKDKLQRTAYIARCIRYVCLLKFGWLSAEDRDPMHDKANEASRRYLTTNGGLTHRLRTAWELDDLLHDGIHLSKDDRSVLHAALVPTTEEAEQTPESVAAKEVAEVRFKTLITALETGQEIEKETWEALTKEHRKIIYRARSIKNRQDLRHHGLDALVIACTLPWAANTTVEQGGWCQLDPQDGSVSSVHCPIFDTRDHGQVIKEIARDKLASLLNSDPADKEALDQIVHYRPHLKHAQVFDTQLYGRREAYAGKELDEPKMVVRKRLKELTPGALNPKGTGSIIFSPLLREHISKSWKAYTADSENWQRVLKQTKSIFGEKLATALANKDTKPTTLTALRGKIERMEKGLKTIPDDKAWDELMKYLHGELGGAQTKKAVFPDDFIQRLRHPIYDHCSISSVKVIGQAKGDSNFVELRPGTHSYLKYASGYGPMRVYDAATKASKSKNFICWHVRRYYPKKIDPATGRKVSSEWDDMPDECRGRKLRATFKNGQVVRFQHAIPEKGIDAGTNWVIREREAPTRTNASIMLLPAHLATTVQDPDNPKAQINSKDTRSVSMGLNDFMRALGYIPAERGL